MSEFTEEIVNNLLARTDAEINILWNPDHEKVKFVEINNVAGFFISLINIYFSCQDLY